MSIVRAMIRNVMRGASKQGGSTITQQVVKNLLLTPEQTIERKIKEAVLACMLEERYTKDEILEIYLNKIFFGNTAYGISAAAKLYYHKELGQITIAEAAMLAGLLKAPSTYSPVTNYPRARERQMYVIRQMEKAGFISNEDADVARREKIKVYAASSQNVYNAPFYVAEVKRILDEKWPNLNLTNDGLEIYTAVDVDADKFATKALRSGLRDVDKRRGYRGPLNNIPGADIQSYIDKTRIVGDSFDRDELYPALVVSIDRNAQTAQVVVGKSATRKKVTWKGKGWLTKYLDKKDHVSFGQFNDHLHVGDVIEVAITTEDGTAEIDQTPEVEGAITILNPETGRVVAVVGGYSYVRSKFNRVTQGMRQPGSSFKPIVYLSAIDSYGFTPATVVDDSPRTFRVGDQFWTPGNFDGKFLGRMTLQRALEKSRNIISADLVSRIGADAVIRYARKLGIASRLQRVMSIALGSSEVTLLELSRAYGVFAARGVLVDSTFITKIVDRHGRVLFDADAERLTHASPVISEQSAFIMTHMMKGVVERGTAIKVKALNRPTAGKTGTSNNQMDAWFIGFTPQWVCGIWVGFDEKKEIGEKETGGVIAAPIFVDAMRDFLAKEDTVQYERLANEAKLESERRGVTYVPPAPLEAADFVVPDGVDPFWIDEDSGAVVTSDTPRAVLTYLPKGVEIESELKTDSDSSVYLDSY
jgi:penicillin-binding protein 1A